MSDNPLTFESATKLAVPDETFFIWGYVENINYFLNTALTEYEAADAETKTATKKAYTRRRYKGDSNPSNVSSHDYDYLYDPGRRTSAALPGWSFILYDGTEKRQFTTDATVYQLRRWLTKEAKVKMRLYTQGSSYPIDKAFPTSI